MATEADIPDHISLTKREVEDKELPSELSDITVNEVPQEEKEKVESWFSQPPETNKILEKIENMQVAHDIEIADVNVVNKANVGAIEGEIFLQSPSVADREPKKNTEEKQKNTTEELRGSQDEEKRGMITDENIIVEANSVQNAGVISQTTDLAEGSSMDIGKLEAFCNIEENMDNVLSTNTTSTEQDLRETSFEGEDKKSKTSSSSVGMEMGPETIQPEEMLCDGAKDVCTTKETACPHSQKTEEATESGESVKDKLGSSAVSALTKETSSVKVQLDVGGNLGENSSMVFGEGSQETIQLSEAALTEDETQNRNLESSFVQKVEDISFQKVNLETFKEESETGLKDFVKDSQNEAYNQNEIFKNIATADISLSTTGKVNENSEESEPKADVSSRKPEESIRRESKDLTPTEALTTECKHEGVMAVAREDDIGTEEQDQTETPKDKEYSEQSFLQKTDQTEENLESSLDVASEEIDTTAPNEYTETIINIEQQRPVESPEEILGEMRKDEKIISDDISKEIPEEKNFSTVDLDEKNRSAEVEIPNKNGNDLYVPHPPVEETIQVGGEKHDEVSISDSGDRVYEAFEVSKQEEKHVNEIYEASKSPESTILELPSTEGTVNSDKLEKSCELNTEEELKEINTADNIKEEINTAGDDDKKKCTFEEDLPVTNSTALCTGEEADHHGQVDKHSPDSSAEAASESDTGDQCFRASKTENANDQIINKEAIQDYEDPEIADWGEDTEKEMKNEDHPIIDHSPESTCEDTTKCSQENGMEAKNCIAEIGKELETTTEGEGSEKQVPAEENRVQDWSTVSAGKELEAESSKEDDEMTKMPKQEVLEVLQAADGSAKVGDGIAKVAARAAEETKNECCYEKEKEEKEPDRAVLELETNQGGQDTAEQIIKNSVSIQTVESFEEKTVQESSQKDEASEGYETARTSMTIDGGTIADLPSSSVGEKIAEERLKEDKRDAMRSEEEVWNSNTECIDRTFDPTHSTEETEAEVLKNEAEPNEGWNAQSFTGSSSEEIAPIESNLGLVENSSVPDISKREIKEEILEKTDSKVTVVAEETSLTEAEAEYTTQADNSNLVSEDKGLLTTETSENGSNGIDIIAKPAESSNLCENKDMEIPTTRKHGADEAAEKKEPEGKNETPDTLSETEDHGEIATADTSLDGISEQKLQASTLSLEEHKFVTAEVSEKTGEAPLIDKISYSKAETPMVAETTEENIMEMDNESTNPKKTGFKDIEESQNDDVQIEDQELFTPPELNNVKSICESNLELLTRVNTSEVDNSRKIGKLETSEDGKSSDIGLQKDKSETEMEVNEASKGAEACGRGIDIKTGTLDQEDSAKNFEGSSKGSVEIEKAPVEFEAEGHSHGIEASEAKSISALTEKDIKSVEHGEQLRSAPESMAKDTSNRRSPETNQTSIEEESYDDENQTMDSTKEQIWGQDIQEGKQKTNEEMEPKIETQKETNKIPDVIVTEKVPSEIESADESEIIKKQTIEEESCNNELHTISVVDETVNKVTDMDLTLIQSLEATASNNDTEMVKSKVAEDLNQALEASPVTKASEEETKKAIEKPVDVSSSVSEVSEEKINEENIEETENCDDNTDIAPTVVTEVTSLGEIQLNEPVKALDASSEAKSLETTKTADTSQQKAEVESTKLEETSSMVSHLPIHEHEKADIESINVYKSDAINVEVEETKIPDAVSASKDHGVEEIHETGTSLTVGETGTSEIEKPFQEVPEALSEPIYQGVEAACDDEIIAPTVVAEVTSLGQVQLNDGPVKGLDSSSDAKCLETTKPADISQPDAEVNSTKLEESSSMVSHLPKDEHEKADNESINVEKSNAIDVEVEETKITDAVSESKDQRVAQIHETGTSLTVGMTDTKETEKQIKEVPKASYEPIKEGVDAACDDEIIASTVVAEVTSLGQVQLNDKPVKALDTSSDAKCLETTKPADTRKQDAEVDSTKLEETYNMVSHLPIHEHEKADKESKDIEKAHVIDVEAEETKIPDAVSKSKDQDMKEIHEKGTSVTVGETDTRETEKQMKEVPEASYEPFEEGIEAACDEKIIVPSVVAEVTSLGEVQLNDEPVKALDTSSNAKSPETTKPADTSQQDAEVESTKLEETSSLVSHLPIHEHEKADNESINAKKSDAIDFEVEETKIHDAISKSKDQAVKEIHETDTSLTVGETDTNGIEKQSREVPEAVFEPINQGVEAASNDEVAPGQTLQAEKIREQLQMSTSANLSNEEDGETTVIIEKSEDGCRNQDDAEDGNLKLEETSRKASQLLITKRESTNNVNLDKSEADEVKVEETRTLDAVSETKDQGFEEIHDSRISPTAEIIDTGNMEEEFKEVTEKISDHSYQGVGAVAEGQIPDQPPPVSKLEEQLQVSSSALFSNKQDCETMTTTKNIEVESTKKAEMEGEKIKLEEATGMLSTIPTTEHEEADNMSATIENSDADEVEVEEAKTFEAISESKVHGVEEIHEIGPSLNVGKTHKDEVGDEIKAVRETIFEPNYPGVEAIIDRDITPYQTLPIERTEELQEPSFALPKEQDHETITKVEMIKNESTKKDETELNESVADSFETDATEKPFLQDEGPREHLTVQQDTQNRAPEEESTAIEDSSTVKPLEYIPEIKYADSPTEYEKTPIQCSSQDTSNDEDIIDSGNSNKDTENLPPPHPTVKELLPGEVGEKCEEASNLEFQKTETVLESVSAIWSPEVSPISEGTEIKKNQLKAAITEVRDSENFSEETTEEDEAIEKYTSKEMITEEKQVVRNSPPGSPSEETVTTCNQEDELQAEDYPGERKNDTFETTSNETPHEELFEESERAGADKTIKEMITAEDRNVKDPYQLSVGDRTEANISPAEEAKDGKNVDKAPIKLDLVNQGDETNIRETATEATAPIKEIKSSEVMLVKHEDRTGDNDAETVMSKDEQLQNTDLDVPPVTDAVTEEAPYEKAGETVEEVIISAPKSPTHETIETYEVNKETSTADTNNSERPMDNEKLEHKSLEPENLKEQDVCANKPSISSCTAASQEEIADKESENTIDEKEHDFTSDKQTTEAVSLLEEGKSIQCEVEHTKDEEPVEVSTIGNERNLVDTNIYGTITANEDEETQRQNEKPNVLSCVKDTEVSHEKGIMELAEVNEITKDTQEKEKSSLPVSHEQIARKADPNECTETTESSASKNVPLMQEDPTAKAFQNAEVEDLKAVYASVPEPEDKRVEYGEEKRIGEECQEKTEKPIPIQSAKISSTDLLNRSTKETLQVVEHLTEETELAGNKEELQTETTETAKVEEAKTDEKKDEGEEEDEHKRADLGSDAPVMVEASRDTDVKIAHKKSHNILSGVGSKVKHSIAKVKKVITGKSSHPKTSSPK